MLKKQLYQNKAEKEGKRIEGENLKKKNNSRMIDLNSAL